MEKNLQHVNLFKNDQWKPLSYLLPKNRDRHFQKQTSTVPVQAGYKDSISCWNN